MRTKPDWALAFAGALFLAAGAIFLWSGLSGLLYHTPIYFKGPSWVDPWQAIIGGPLLAGLGLFLIAISFRKNRGDDQHQP
jgi:putative Mn2+ efflux pump MntP